MIYKVLLRERAPNFRKRVPTPSSGQKSKPSNKPEACRPIRWLRIRLTLRLFKWSRHVLPKHQTSSEVHGFTTLKTIFFIVTIEDPQIYHYISLFFLITVFNYSLFMSDVGMAQSVWFWAGRPTSDFRQRQEIVFSTIYGLVRAPRTLLTVGYQGTSPVLRGPGCEANRSPTRITEAKSGGALPPLPPTSSWRGA
jgi:hypothetical protein